MMFTKTSSLRSHSLHPLITFRFTISPLSHLTYIKFSFSECPRPQYYISVEILLYLSSRPLNMSFLLTLPNEILLQIIEDVFPDNIVNFVSSWKDIYTLAQDRLNTHRKGSRIYKDVVLRGCYQWWIGITLGIRSFEGGSSTVRSLSQVQGYIRRGCSGLRLSWQKTRLTI